MLDKESARKILKTYGFRNNSIEPILLEIDDMVNLFVTFKTKYGLLSRTLPFDNTNNLEEFLKKYVWYKENLDNENILVEFDDYETKSPKITFMVDGKDFDLKDLEPEEEIEVLEIDMTPEEDLQLLNVVKEKITNAFKNIETKERLTADAIADYSNKLLEYNKVTGEAIEDKEILFEKFDENKYRKEIDSIYDKYNSDKINFVKYLDDMINLLENVLTDKTYIENVYLEACYREEINRLILKVQKYSEYQMVLNSKKLFKSKSKSISFSQYLENDPIYKTEISKKDIEEQIKIEASNTLIELKNNTVDELKLIYGIKEIEEPKEEIKEEVLEKKEVDINDLNSYFLTLNNKQRNIALIISSPVKELLNMLDNMNLENALREIKKEKYYFIKFRELYEVLANQDNFAATRKYLKLLKLDSIDEFISSIISIKQSLNMTRFSLPENIIIKYKMGVVLKQGLLNASIKNEYPVNNKGSNSYYITTLKNKIDIYYAPYYIYIDDEGNLQNRKNDSIITFNIKGYKLTDKEEIKVNDYILKNKNEVILFNTKTYCSNNLVLEQGDYNE